MWPISITVSNLVQIDQELAKIFSFVYFVFSKMAAAAILDFQKVILISSSLLSFLFQSSVITVIIITVDGLECVML